MPYPLLVVRHSGEICSGIDHTALELGQAVCHFEGKKCNYGSRKRSSDFCEPTLPLDT